MVYQYGILIELDTGSSIPVSFDTPLAKATKSLSVVEYQRALNILCEDLRVAPDERKGTSIHASTVMLHNAPEGASMPRRRKYNMVNIRYRNLQSVARAYVGDACFIY